MSADVIYLLLTAEELIFQDSSALDEEYVKIAIYSSKGNLDRISYIYQENEIIFENELVVNLDNLYPKNNRTLFQRIEKYVGKLNSEDIDNIEEEFLNSYSVSASILDVILYGIGAYSVLIDLIENSILRYDFAIPYGLDNKNAFSSKTFNYILPYLNFIQKIRTGTVKHLASFVQLFIHIWENLFKSGETIDINFVTQNHMRMLQMLSDRQISQLETEINRSNELVKQVSSTHEILLQRIEKLEKDIEELKKKPEEPPKPVSVTSVSKLSGGPPGYQSYYRL